MIRSTNRRSHSKSKERSKDEDVQAVEWIGSTLTIYLRNLESVKLLKHNLFNGKCENELSTSYAMDSTLG